MDDKLKRLTT